MRIEYGIKSELGPPVLCLFWTPKRAVGASARAYATTLYTQSIYKCCCLFFFLSNLPQQCNDVYTYISSGQSQKICISCFRGSFAHTAVVIIYNFHIFSKHNHSLSVLLMGFFSYARTHTHQLVVITAPCELDAHDSDAMHNEQLFVCLFFGIDLYAHTDN